MEAHELDRLLKGARRAAPDAPLPGDFSWQVLKALPPRTLALWTGGMLAILAMVLALSAVGTALWVTDSHATTEEPPALTLYQGSGLSWPEAR